MVGTLATFTDRSKIERRALKISDPIERLRYLRQHATTPTPSSFGWRWIAYLVFVMGVVPMGSDALNREPLNRASFNRATLSSMPANSTPAPVAVSQQVSEIPNVWPVDQSSEYDLYSNGLRIENKLEISNQPRSYSLIERASAALGPLRSQPAGIVFHTTEGDQTKFEPDQKTALKRIGQNLLLFIRSKRAYHFVIDRFGRVHRIVVESDAANHAGHSVWADAQWSYVDLNASFLGVAFEARMQDEQPINEAQLHSARSLTEMLRAKYNLAAGNCVTHAQVSVNPENMRIGWHTDWGSKFPFKGIGLPDNYETPNPSLYMFGFEYDPAYTKATGPDLWKGLTLAEGRLGEAAAAHGVAITEYRKSLQKRYRDTVTAQQNRAAEETN